MSFIAKSLYILKLDILSTQIIILSEEKDQVVRLDLFVGIYFAVWYVQYCPPQNNDNIRTDAEFLWDWKSACLLCHGKHETSHLVYHSTVGGGLADTHCPEKESKDVATALAKTPQPDLFLPGKPDLPVEWLLLDVHQCLATGVFQNL